MRQRDCEEPTHPPYRKVFQELRLTTRQLPRKTRSPEEDAQHLGDPGLVRRRNLLRERGKNHQGEEKHAPAQGHVQDYSSPGKRPLGLAVGVPTRPYTHDQARQLGDAHRDARVEADNDDSEPGKNGSSDVVAKSLRTANRPMSNASPIVSKPATPSPTDVAPALLKKRSNKETHTQPGPQRRTQRGGARAPADRGPNQRRG